jgi:hypothetical protein
MRPLVQLLAAGTLVALAAGCTSSVSRSPGPSAEATTASHAQNGESTGPFNPVRCRPLPKPPLRILE